MVILPVSEREFEFWKERERDPEQIGSMSR